jgi:hypothetical protein
MSASTQSLKSLNKGILTSQNTKRMHAFDPPYSEQGYAAFDLQADCHCRTGFQITNFRGQYQENLFVRL